jgi:5-methyltetrahydropteroyltriglutamate--homocysteine methyltransferase
MTVQYRADHVGSLLRPPELLEARKSHQAGRLTLEQLRAAEDQAILKALEMQRQTGIGIVSDGEYRRNWFASGFADAVEGLVPNPDPQAPQYGWHGPHSAVATATMPELHGITEVAGARLRLARRIAGHEAAFMARHAPGPWKITLTPPGWLGDMFKPGLSDRFYASREELLADVVGMYQQEIRNLVADGASYIQFDSLAYVQPQFSREELEGRIVIDNALCDAVDRSKATIGLHMCRGNNQGSWISEGTYEACAEKAFSQLRTDRFLLEYDTPRAGGFEPLRFVPKDKTVMLGLISTKTPQLESQDLLMRRIEEAAKYVPIENLAIGPQCGFASSEYGNPLSWDDQRKKLELVVATARKVWG